MLATQQFDGMNVWEHGLSVAFTYGEIKAYVSDSHNGLALEGFDDPAWLKNKVLWERMIESSAERITTLEAIRNYHLYHDCGKPYCLEIDENGHRHFPNHAEISRQIWNAHSDGGEDDRLTGELIGMDMLVHTVKGEAVVEFARHPYAPTLLYTGLAEIYSNAKHLSRLNSDGFKIKRKQLDKVAKAIIKSTT